MNHDLALPQRRAWLQTLSRPRHGAWRRGIVDHFVGWIVPSRRRARTLVRETLVRC